MKKISFEMLKDLNSRKNGLSEIEISKQYLTYGKNEITESNEHPLIALIGNTLKDPMIWFLVGTGTVFIIIGNTRDAVVLFIAIFPLLFMDAILHWRAHASTSNLKNQLSTKVTVLREDKEVHIHAYALVPGDLLIVRPGLFIPADGLFQEGNNLQVDESILTGEAFPITKHASPLNPFLIKEEISVDPTTLGYAGTRVITGLGKMRVLFTGQHTAYGEIIQIVSKLPHEQTPLQRSIAKLVLFLIFAASILCLLLASVRIYQGHGLLDALLSAATLAIAAIPEEFPVVFSFFLGVGIYRLAKRKALVRRAVSVENIGRVTHICTDKTGTITIGVLQLTHIKPVEGLTTQDVLAVALAASNRDGSDPVDVAIRDLSTLQNLPIKNLLHTFPFTEDRKRESSFVLEDNGQTLAYMKGSPETVLLRSALSENMRQHWKEETAKLARQGHKVLACARKILTTDEINLNIEPQCDFEFCGLLAFEDPPRKEVADAISYCQHNKIKVLMITGDHQDTAVAIAKDIGLGGNVPIAVSAEEAPEKFQADWLKKNPDFLCALHVIARCTPLQKLTIVNALKLSGHIVAVTGDGVNDVPALQAADIGIAMGERGTRSAKEVASIILADDNFRTIVWAINEGLQLFYNLKLSFKYLLLIHIPFVLTAAFIPLLGYPLIYLPIHIVWLELIIHPSALLAFQQPAPLIMDAPYRTQRKFFNYSDGIGIFLIGLGLAVVLGFGFVSGLNENLGLGHARAKAMVFLTLWSAGIIASFTKFKTRLSILIVFFTLLTTVIAVQIPIFANTLYLKPLHLTDWVTTGVYVIGFLLIQTIGDFLFDKWWSQGESNP